MKLGTLATLMLVVAVAAEGFQLAASDADTQTRALSTCAVALLAFLVGTRFGRQLYRQERLRAIGWLPSSVAWHTDAHGERHAIVQQKNGGIVTIPIPADVDSDDALVYVLVQLNERRAA